MEDQVQLWQELGDQVIHNVAAVAHAAHDPAHAMLMTMVAAISAGVILLVTAHRLNLPAIVLLVAGGLALGPQGLALVRPDTLGDGLRVIVSLAIGLILFEGGLTLDVRGYRSASTMIQRLLTVGMLTTWLATAAAVWVVFRYPLAFCLLAASLVVVTGPTVIAPLLKRIKVQSKLHNILHWEGVLIDPIGVFVAILCFEFIEGQTGQRVLALFLLRFAWGLGLGIIGGLLIYWLIRLRLVVEEMINVFALAAAVLIFGLAEALFSESGLLAVTASGFVLGLLQPGELKQIRHFKAEITDLLIGTLFILLVARLDLHRFAEFGAKGTLLVGLVILVARPLNILHSSWGLPFNWREKLFLSWVAPRGIVAASMASLFAINLQKKGIFPQAPFLETFTYSVIITTVVLQGFSAGLLAWILGLKRPEPTGWLIVGAHAFGRRIASHLQERGQVSAILMDTNPATIEQARQQGFKALLGDARDPNIAESGQLQAVGNLLALTDNSDLNILLCQRWAGELSKKRVFFWSSDHDDSTKFTGYLVWGQLPKPSIISEELERGDAELVAVQPDGPPPDPLSTVLLTARGAEVKFEPGEPNSLKGEVRQQALFLRRKADYLVRSLRPECIVDLVATDLETMFTDLVNCLAALAPQLPKEKTVRDLLRREQAFSTVLGHGVASPHAYSDTIETPLCALARLPSGIDFQAPAGQSIRLVFLLISPPQDPKIHLEILAAIARLVSREDIRERLSGATTAAEVLATVRNFSF